MIFFLDPIGCLMLWALFWWQLPLYHFGVIFYIVWFQHLTAAHHLLVVVYNQLVSMSSYISLVLHASLSCGCDGTCLINFTSLSIFFIFPASLSLGCIGTCFKNCNWSFFLFALIFLYFLLITLLALSKDFFGDKMLLNLFFDRF